MLQNLSNCKCLIAVLVALFVGSGSTQSAAQSNDGPLSDNERASIMFDLNLKEILDLPPLKNMDFQQMMDQQGIPRDENFDFTKVNRIFGGIQIPADPSAMQPRPGEDLPFNFFVRFEFSESDAAKKLLDGIKDQGSKEHNVNGKTYYSPSSGAEPPNLRVHSVNSTTIEMGTERYVMLKDRNVVSKSLAGYWKQIAKGNAFRVSVDLESNREVVDMMMEQAKATAPSGAEPMLNLVDDLAGLSIGLDFDSDDLLTLRASGKDDEATKNLQSGIDGLLGMGKFMGQSQLSNAPVDDKAKEMAKQVLDQLKATVEGNSVIVNIKKPDGLDDMAKEMMGR